MSKKQKKRKELEKDLLFYLDYYSNFTEEFKKRIADKEIAELIEKLKKKES